MLDLRPIASRSARLAMLDEPGIGAGAFLQYALAHNPNAEVPFLYEHDLDHDGEVRLIGHSLRDLETIRDRCAAWYHAHDVRAGEIVGVHLSDGINPFLQFLALTALGAIPALINSAMPPDTLRAYLDHVGVVALVSDDPAVAGRHRLRFVTTPDAVRANDSGATALPSEYPHAPAADDMVALIHSSGTTGMPKATIVGHQRYWVGRRDRVLRFPSQPSDRLLSAMPQTHAAGISYLLNSTLIGLPTVAVSSWRRAVIEPVMRVFQPTVMVAFPRSYVELATGRPPTLATANIHTWISTGDRAHYGHVRRLVQLGRRPAGLVGPTELAGSRFIDGLGSSELGMSLFEHITTPETERADCCIGAPIDVVEAATVLTPDGVEISDGSAGLLGVKSPTRTPGYWNAPDLTDQHTLSGFWLSGDIVRKADDGRFYHLDRSADVIDAADGPVYSLPLEEVLLADCAGLVQDCAVVGVPGTGGKACPVAMIVLPSDVVEPTADELLTSLNAALRSADLPVLSAAVVARRDADLPVGPTGKVLKRELRTRLAESLIPG
ncbi:class I adenylate-forming enzyme family protein [Nocardia sp. CA-129566]|uniref:class I adenylate-forming enzyme family protein n=1 Tax=Nocardia sp. CA-129566 TaxID=3239976 RepID=UPI003D97FA0F